MDVIIQIILYLYNTSFLTLVDWKINNWKNSLKKWVFVKVWAPFKDSFTMHGFCTSSECHECQKVTSNKSRRELPVTLQRKLLSLQLLLKLWLFKHVQSFPVILYFISKKAQILIALSFYFFSIVRLFNMAGYVLGQFFY